MDIRAYYRYWGKAKPLGAEGAPYHLLPYHCLDLAAAGLCLLRKVGLSLGTSATALGQTSEQFLFLQGFFMANQYLGSFGKGLKAEGL